MEYQIAFAPDLGIAVEQFAVQWNADPKTHAIGEAHVDANTAEAYDLGAVAELVIIPLLVGLGTNALYDLVKERLFASGVRNRITHVEIEKPDGTRVLVIVAEEE